MTRKYSSSLIVPDQPRRRFLQGLAAGGVLLGLSSWLGPVRAGVAPGAVTGAAPVLSGTEFDLTIAETPVNFTGAPRLATTINGSIPAPILRWPRGSAASWSGSSTGRAPSILPASYPVTSRPA